VRTSPLVAAALLAAAPLAAQETTAAGAEDRVHTVQSGETLWGIAQSFLSDPFLWPEIFRLNTATVADPARIYPRQRLLLPAGVAETGTATDRTVFFPVEPTVRNRILGAEGPPVAVVTPADYYRASFLARPAEVAEVGKVAGPISPTVVPIARAPQIQPYDRIHLAVDSGAVVAVGDRLHFVRENGKIDPLGRVYHSTGLGIVSAVDGRTATVVVVEMFDRIEVADMAMPAARFPVPVGVVPAAAQGPDARIVGFAENHAVHTTEEQAFLDVGRADGIREGDEFGAYLPAERATWGTEPPEPVARMQVVKVTEHTATARIVSIRQPALAPGLPARRVARMP
jgi:hypothetical protein